MLATRTRWCKTHSSRSTSRRASAPANARPGRRGGRADLRAAFSFSARRRWPFIALVYRAATNASELLILHAQDIAGEPATILKLPRRVPAGFHGSFVAANA
jgi:hypothetical protein